MKTAGAEPAARARPRLRTRLIAWYAGSLCVVLLLGAFSVRLLVSRTLDRAHEDAVSASIALFQQFFRVEIAEYRTVEATLTHIASELVFEDRELTVRRPNGTPYPPAGSAALRPSLVLRPPLRTSSFALDPELAPGWRIEVRSSAATLAAASRRIDYWLLGGIPVVVAVAALLGWWLAGRALRPIGRMAAQAKTLSISDGARLALLDPADELGRLGASFNRVLDRLDETQEQQRRFLADAAHELRAPLARLRSHAEMGRLAVRAAADAEVRPQAAKALVAVEREVAAASETVGGLLAIARAEAGSAAVHLADGVLDDLVADCLPRWRDSAEAAGVCVELGTFEEVHAHFDATLVRQLLGSLMDNAIHYSPRGSTITVDLHGSETHVTLRVEDEGMGIPQADREQVFERFYRSPAARAHRPDGSGLGLPLARWIVEQHRGEISARDRADGGAGVAMEAVWPRCPNASAARARSGVA